MSLPFSLKCYKRIALRYGWRGGLWSETYNFARLSFLLTAKHTEFPEKVVPLHQTYKKYGFLRCL